MKKLEASKSISKKSTIDFGIVHSHAAGIDLGSKSHFVATGQDATSLREFGVYTEEHHEMAK